MKTLELIFTALLLTAIITGIDKLSISEIFSKNNNREDIFYYYEDVNRCIIGEDTLMYDACSDERCDSFYSNFNYIGKGLYYNKLMNTIGDSIYIYSYKDSTFVSLRFYQINNI